MSFGNRVKKNIGPASAVSEAQKNEGLRQLKGIALEYIRQYFNGQSVASIHGQAVFNVLTGVATLEPGDVSLTDVTELHDKLLCMMSVFSDGETADEDEEPGVFEDQEPGL